MFFTFESRCSSCILVSHPKQVFSEFVFGRVKESRICNASNVSRFWGIWNFEVMSEQKLRLCELCQLFLTCIGQQWGRLCWVMRWQLTPSSVPKPLQAVFSDKRVLKNVRLVRWLYSCAPRRWHEWVLTDAVACLYVFRGRQKNPGVVGSADAADCTLD